MCHTACIILSYVRTTYILTLRSWVKKHEYSSSVIYAIWRLIMHLWSHLYTPILLIYWYNGQLGLFKCQCLATLSLKTMCIMACEFAFITCYDALIEHYTHCCNCLWKGLAVYLMWFCNGERLELISSWSDSKDGFNSTADERGDRTREG